MKKYEEGVEQKEKDNEMTITQVMWKHKKKNKLSILNKRKKLNIKWNLYFII